MRHHKEQVILDAYNPDDVEFIDGMAHCIIGVSASSPFRVFYSMSEIMKTLATQGMTIEEAEIEAKEYTNFTGAYNTAPIIMDDLYFYRTETFYDDPDFK